MKRIIIIGASSGIGRLIALDFAHRGWRVGIAARRADRLEEIRKQFPEQIVCHAFDASADNAADEFRKLISELGGMDMLLYAAGCGWYNPELDSDYEQHTVDVNVKGFTTIIDTAYLYFKNIGSGHIAAITSIAGTRGMGIAPAYSATKRYQWSYLQAIEQLAHTDKNHIKISDIRPGFIQTDLINRGPQNLPMTMQPDYAARIIVRTLLKGKRKKVLDWRWALLTRLWSVIPHPIWRNLPIPALLGDKK